MGGGQDEEEDREGEDEWAPGEHPDIIRTCAEGPCGEGGRRLREEFQARSGKVTWLDLFTNHLCLVVSMTRNTFLVIRTVE